MDAVPYSELENVKQLLSDERKLSEFRRERWENAEARLEHVWNQAVEACREKLGKHTPPCDPNLATPCWLCWQNAKLTALLRLDRSGYTTVRERIEAKRRQVAKAICDRDAEGWNYELEGMNKMALAVTELFGEKE
jgi:hypothetical protein